jgi:parallel beta-helix repeat protein
MAREVVAMANGTVRFTIPIPGILTGLVLCGIVTAAGPHAGWASAACAPAPSAKTVVNVKAAPYHARGNGTGDDTVALQMAIQAVAGTGGTVLVPAGVYLVDATARQGKVGLALGSRMTLKLAPGAVLKARPNGSESYAILSLDDVSDVNVVGGTLEGERAAHQGTTGEWGMGLRITHSARVAVDGVTARECWGDGFYVGGHSSDITLCDSVGDHNRRQGLSIVGVDRMVVRGCTFKDTAGTEPECGIDVEPNRGEAVTGLAITDCLLQGNRGGGFAGGPAARDAYAAIFTGSRIANNRVIGNRGWGIAISSCEGNAVEGNVIQDTDGHGILLRSQARSMRISGNTVVRSRKAGILLEDCAGSTVTGNAVTDNPGGGIVNARGSGAALSGNRESGNGKPVY